jgi:hypothetical protein
MRRRAALYEKDSGAYCVRGSSLTPKSLGIRFKTLVTGLQSITWEDRSCALSRTVAAVFFRFNESSNT